MSRNYISHGRSIVVLALPLSTMVLGGGCGEEVPYCSENERYEFAACFDGQTEAFGVRESGGRLAAEVALCSELRIFCSHDGTTRLYGETAGPELAMCGTSSDAVDPDVGFDEPYCDLAFPEQKPRCVSVPCDGVVYRVGGFGEDEPRAESPIPTCPASSTIPVCGEHPQLSVVGEDDDFFAALRGDTPTDSFVIAAVCDPPELFETFDCALEASADAPLLAVCDAGVPRCANGQPPYCASLGCD
tara:strand:- start:599 stop:1333 length:735 start_codon:yes stop_codon:yes gene_type:complete